MTITRFAVFLSAAITAAAIAACFVHYEDPAYIWDYSFYFDKYKLYGSIFGTEHWLYWMGVEIYKSDYNASLIAPLMPFHVLFGDSRTAYIAAIAICLIVPTTLAIAYVTIATTLPTAPKPAKLLVTLAAFLYTPLWASALRGMPDVGAMLPLMLGTYVIWKSDFYSRRPIVNGIVSGLLLWLAFLFRRWLAFSIVGLLLATGLVVAFRILRTRNIHEATRPLIGATACALVIAGAVALFQFELAERILTTTYSDIYEGYRTNILGQITVIAHRSSPAILALIGLGCALTIYRRSAFPIFCLIAATITFALFSRVQDTGFQHSMPIFVWLFPAYAAAITFLVLRAPRLGAISIMAIILASFLGTFSPPFRSNLPSALYAAEPTLPMRLGNFSEYQRLIADLELLTEDGKTLAVFAGNTVLSDELLIRLSPKLKSRYIYVSVVDSRDGFRTAPLSADYAVVTSPTAVHLKPGAMQTISVPNDMILSGEDIGAAFNLESGPYEIANGYSAYIYRRNRPIDAHEYEKMFDVFRRSYPHWSSPLEIQD